MEKVQLGRAARSSLRRLKECMGVKVQDCASVQRMQTAEKQRCRDVLVIGRIKFRCKSPKHSSDSQVVFMMPIE